MSILAVYDDKAIAISGGIPDGENLWLTTAEFASCTGWVLKPEGACLGERCVPIPPARRPEFIRDSGRLFNLAAFGRLIGQCVVHDRGGSVWVFGPPATERNRTLLSLNAPDFQLPDLEGRTHRLTDYRGNKVLLFAWASW